MKHAVIIGATGGIGQALSKQFKGTFDLTLVGRNQATLRHLKSSTEGNAIATDVASELEVQALFEDLPKIDVLVYAAGDIQPELLKTAKGEHYHRVMDANVNGLFYTLKHAANALNEGARVFVIGARPELIQHRGFAAYAAAKAGAAALVAIAREELGRKAAFTLVLPIAVATPFWDNLGQSPPKGALEPSAVADAIVESLDADPQDELRVG